MRHYETLFIVNPDLAEEEYKDVLKKFNDLIEKKRGVFVKQDEWGKQRLAYLVKKFDHGSYVLLDYCGEPGMTAELERDLKLDDRVLMYQTVKLADDVDPQALTAKEEEVKKETPTADDQASEKEEGSQGEPVNSTQEVKNGI